MVASAATNAILTTSVVSRNCSAERNFGSCTRALYNERDAEDVFRPHARHSHRLQDHVRLHLQAGRHGELPRAENSDVSEISGQAGVDARRSGTGKMRRV